MAIAIRLIVMKMTVCAGNVAGMWLVLKVLVFAGLGEHF